jgi:hypothetical protein
MTLNSETNKRFHGIVGFSIPFKIKSDAEKCLELLDLQLDEGDDAYIAKENIY